MSRTRIAWTFCLLVAAALAGRAAVAQEACADCHDVDPAKVEASVHGALACTDCHQGADQLPHPDGVGAPQCATCHEDEVQGFQDGVHAQAIAGDKGWVTGCVACHGDVHTILPADDPASPINRTHIAETCGACHANPQMAERFKLRVVRPVEAYLKSVHARAIAAGKRAPSAAPATVRTPSSRPATRARRSTTSGSSTPAPSATARSPPPSAPASTARRWPPACARPPRAPIATASTASSRRRSTTRRSTPPTSPP